MSVLVDDWTGCYKRGWGQEILPEAYAHPAKLSFSLGEGIYRHLAEENWITPGMTVIDPFAGIGGTAYHAALRGLSWVGVELEPRFVALAQENIDLWRKRYGAVIPGYGSARIIQGDSRRLLAVIADAELAVSSPPYAETGLGIRHTTGVHWGAEPAEKSKAREQLNKLTELDEYGVTPGQLGAMPPGSFDAAISSPPYAGNSKSDYLLSNDGKHRQRDEHRGYRQGEGSFRGSETYGDSPGQLGRMKDDGFDAAVSSPPFRQTTGGTNVTSDSGPLADAALVHRHAAGNQAAQGYGAADGQLANMAEGEFDAAVTSPGYGGSELSTDKKFADAVARDRRNSSHLDLSADAYGDENISGMNGDNFWSAAAVIVAQTYAALRVGSMAVWILKGFIRDGKLVDFPAQWRALCEAAGFVTLHEHHALLTTDHGTQLAHDGNHKHKRTERKSFFCRLAEKKGAPPIDYETIYCMQKGSP